MLDFFVILLKIKENHLKGFYFFVCVEENLFQLPPSRGKIRERKSSETREK